MSALTSFPSSSLIKLAPGLSELTAARLLDVMRRTRGTIARNDALTRLFICRTPCRRLAATRERSASRTPQDTAPTKIRRGPARVQAAQTGGVSERYCLSMILLVAQVSVPEPSGGTGSPRVLAAAAPLTADSSPRSAGGWPSGRVSSALPLQTSDIQTCATNNKLIPFLLSRNSP